MVVVVVVAVTVVVAVAVAMAIVVTVVVVVMLVAVAVAVAVAVLVVVVAALSHPIFFLPEKWKREEGRRAHFPRSGWQPSLAPYLCHCKQATW